MSKKKGKQERGVKHIKERKKYSKIYCRYIAIIKIPKRIGY